MACVAVRDILTGCDSFDFGGIDRILFLNKSDLTSITKFTDGTITSVGVGTNAFIQEYEPVIDSAQFTEELQADGPSKFYLQTLNFSLQKLTAAQIDEIENVPFFKLIAFVRLNSGEWMVLGEKGRGLTGVSANTDTGASQSDAKVVTMSFTAANLGKANYIAESAVLALLNGRAGTAGPLGPNIG
jgi:hypothetical protein